VERKLDVQGEWLRRNNLAKFGCKGRVAEREVYRESWM